MSVPPSAPDTTYAPEIFNVGDEKKARAIILTAEFGQSTDQRWATETPYMAEVLGDSLAITKDMIVLDYGCGIGRLSKALIDRYGCHVIGVDIAHNMRVLAQVHVKSDRFTSVAPAAFAQLLDHGLVCDAAFSVWVLQHCFRPEQDIAVIRRAVKPAGRLCVVNNVHRAVPTRERGFVSDGIDMLDLLKRNFTVGRVGKLRADILTPQAVEQSFVADMTNDLLPETEARHG